MRTISISVVAAILVGCQASLSHAQMLQTTTPFQQFGDSYYSGFGLNWGLQGPGWSANFPGGGSFPAFGGANPNAGLSGGFTGRIGNVSGGLGFNWYQGSNRYNSVTAPSVTTMDGYPGSMFSGSVRPFVTSITPVVGFRAPNEEIRDAGVARQNATLQDIAQRKAEGRRNKAYEYWARGQKAEESGNLKMARANFRLALGKAEEPLRSEIAARMIRHGWMK